MKLSVIVPVYNEARTIPRIVERVGEASPDIPRELIVAADGSTDETPRVLGKLAAESGEQIKVISHEVTPHFFFDRIGGGFYPVSNFARPGGRWWCGERV